jgi:hypothetical protein
MDSKLKDNGFCTEFISWLRPLVSGLSTRKQGFIVRLLVVLFAMDKVAEFRFFSEYFSFQLSVLS